MFGVITDISSRTGESIRSIYSFPQSIIVTMWKDLQYEHWYDRGQHSDLSTKEDDLAKFKRLQKEAGVKL